MHPPPWYRSCSNPPHFYVTLYIYLALGLQEVNHEKGHIRPLKTWVNYCKGSLVACSVRCSVSVILLTGGGFVWGRNFSFTHTKYSFWWHGATGDNAIDLPSTLHHRSIRHPLQFYYEPSVFIPQKTNLIFWFQASNYVRLVLFAFSSVSCVTRDETFVLDLANYSLGFDHSR